MFYFRLALLSVLLAGCAAYDNSSPVRGGAGTTSAGGAAGAAVTDGGSAGSGGSPSASTAGDAGSPSAGVGGGGATAGDSGGGMSGGGSSDNASGGGGLGGMSSAGAGGALAGGQVDVWYEAEAPDNEIDNGTVRSKCAKTCASVADKQSCCSGGGELRQLLGRGGSNNAGGGVTFKNVTVPSDGVYDVTWWYHCGLNDHWHDGNCGGAPYPAWMSFYNPAANPQPGCRPHLIAVNGAQVDGPDHKTPFWQFPCFGGGWDIMHVATTPLSLKAGKNQIRLGAPHIADLDAVDIDAIHVVTAGTGVAPVVPEPRAIAGDDGRK